MPGQTNQKGSVGGRCSVLFQVRRGFVQARHGKALLLIIENNSRQQRGAGGCGIYFIVDKLMYERCQNIRLKNNFHLCCLLSENHIKKYKHCAQSQPSHDSSAINRKKKEPEIEGRTTCVFSGIDGGCWDCCVCCYWVRCLLLRSNYTFTWILWDLSAYLEIIKLRNRTTLGSFVTKNSIHQCFQALRGMY